MRIPKLQARSASPQELPVLCIGSPRVEWLDGEALTYTEAISESPEDLASAAREAAGLEGKRLRRCVLVLPEERFVSAVHQLPGLGEDELRGVLSRKAAQDLGVDERETLFCALPMGKAPDRAQGGGFCVWSIRRGEVHDLVQALRREGFNVQSVVALRGGLLSCAQDLIGGASAPFLVAAVEADRTYLGLARSGELLMQTTLPHRVDDGLANHAMGLVQELRNFGAYWRRFGRGEELAGLVAVGLESTFIDALETAVRGALGGVEFLRADLELNQPEPRASLLRAAASQGTYALDFTLKLPPSPKRIAAATGIAFAAACGVAYAVHGTWSEDLTDSRRDLVALRLAREEHADANERRGTEREARAELDLELQNLQRLGSAGLPLEELLQVGLNSLDASSKLLSLAAGAGPAGFELTLSAETESDVRRSQAALNHAQDELRSTGLFESVDLRPPDRLPEAGADRPLVFTVEARLEGGR